MGKFIRSWLLPACLFLTLDVFVACPEIPAMIHNAIERFRNPVEYGPPPAPIPTPEQIRPQWPTQQPAQPAQPPAKPVRLIWC
ncbi:MAG: hypothetical protein PHE68_04725 [Candidatus Peribacteraceae bacterium]|nr:hypothetical protein [Candidatus Peribacteraceae bacterium]